MFLFIDGNMTAHGFAFRLASEKVYAVFTDFTHDKVSIYVWVFLLLCFGGTFSFSKISNLLCPFRFPEMMPLIK